MTKQVYFDLTSTRQIPGVGFGTYLIDNDQAADAVFVAFKSGYRHIDTAEGYRNEVGVGHGIRNAISELGLRRENIFVTTKLWPGNAAWGQPVKDAAATIRSLEESLER
ncbi:MAG: aldo/keto reductase, partial [Saprospiraceae bacterium]|nr:aldo/keto reductase [Saprospiraceae bacterium]